MYNLYVQLRAWISEEKMKTYKMRQIFSVNLPKNTKN
jgi:hypothetical protein